MQDRGVSRLVSSDVSLLCKQHLLFSQMVPLGVSVSSSFSIRTPVIVE